METLSRDKVYKDARIATRIILASYGAIREADNKNIDQALTYYLRIIDEIRSAIQEVITLDDFFNNFGKNKPDRKEAKDDDLAFPF